MPLNVAQKLITAHLVDGSLLAVTPITLKIDQTLTQDATGTLAMLPPRFYPAVDSRSESFPVRV